MAATKLPSGLEGGKLAALHRVLATELPQCYAHFQDDGSFRELRVYAKDDLSYLAVAKRYGDDGGPMVCFGSGYDVVTCLLALEGTLAANRWIIDKPWDGK